MRVTDTKTSQVYYIHRNVEIAIFFFDSNIFNLYLNQLFPNTLRITNEESKINVVSKTIEGEK